MAAQTSASTARKGTTKHFCWGNCANDSRYPDKLPPGTYFMPFPKPGKIKESMTQLEKNIQNDKAEKARRWIHACGRKGFGIQNIKSHTYICSNHFFSGSGPTEEHPDPLLATLTEAEIEKKLARKRKAPTSRQPIMKRCNKTTNDNVYDISQPEDADIPLEPEQLTKYASTQTEPILISTLTTQTQTDVIPTSNISTETEPDKLAVAGRIQNLLLENELNLLKSQQQMISPSPVQPTNAMDMKAILKSEKKM